MNVPRVSVVMSVYNGERYLRESVESILAQDLADFEFIIVNDGSTDGSRDILAKYERQDRRIRVLDQENRGLTMSLIRGCKEARAEYIARQDADDWSHPERFRCCVGLLKSSPDVTMASSWVRYVDPIGDVVEALERPALPEVATHALLFERMGPPAHGSVTFRRMVYKAIGGYRSEFYYAQDSDLWLRLATVGHIAYAQEYLYHYRLSPETISGAYANLQWEFGELGQRCHLARLHGESEQPFLQQAETLRSRTLQGEIKTPGLPRRRAAANYRIGTGLSHRGNRRAKEYFWNAVRLEPLHWRSWCRLGLELLRDIGTRRAATMDGFPEPSSRRTPSE